MLGLCGGVVPFFRIFTDLSTSLQKGSHRQIGSRRDSDSEDRQAKAEFWSPTPSLVCTLSVEVRVRAQTGRAGRDIRCSSDLHPIFPRFVSVASVLYHPAVTQQLLNDRNRTVTSLLSCPAALSRERPSRASKSEIFTQWSDGHAGFTRSYLVTL